MQLGYVVWKAVDGVAAIASEKSGIQDCYWEYESSSTDRPECSRTEDLWEHGTELQRSIYFDTKNQLFISTEDLVPCRIGHKRTFRIRLEQAAIIPDTSPMASFYTSVSDRTVKNASEGLNQAP